MAGCASVEVSTPLLLQAAADCPATGVPTPSSPGDVGNLFCNEWKSARFSCIMHSYCGIPVLFFHLFMCGSG